MTRLVGWELKALVLTWALYH